MSNTTAKTPRILFLTQWFEPEPAFKGLRFARALRDDGFDVEVATGFPNYPGGILFPGYTLRPYLRDDMDGIPVHRLYEYPSHDSSPARRMLTYCSFFVSCLLFLLIKMRRYDIAYVYHPPIMPGLAASVAGIFHRRPFVLEVQDLWPDSVAASGMSRPWVTRLLKQLCNFTYARAAAIVCQSDGMLDQLQARGVPAEKLVRIYNWSNYMSADADASGAVVPEPIDAAFAGRLNFVYGGNIGQAQSLETVVAAAVQAALLVPNLRLHLIGSGIDRERIAAAISTHAPGGEVLLHGAIMPREMDRVFDRADVLVMHLKDDPLYDITIPSKTQHYLSVGKPIVAGVSGEAARILMSSGAALIVPSDDIPALTQALVTAARATLEEREEAGAQGRQYYNAHLTFDAAIRATASVARAHVAKKATIIC